MVDMPVAAAQHVREQILKRNITEAESREETLRRNVSDLQFQLQESFKKIAQLRNEVIRLQEALEQSNSSVDSSANQ